MDRPDDAALLAELDAAYAEMGAAVERQWNGKHALNLSIPARPQHDTDLIVCNALRKASAALRAALQREQEMAKLDEANRAVREDLGRRLVAAERELSTLRARTEQEDGAELIHQAIPDMAGTEPRPRFTVHCGTMHVYPVTGGRCACGAEPWRNDIVSAPMFGSGIVPLSEASGMVTIYLTNRGNSADS